MFLKQSKAKILALLFRINRGRQFIFISIFEANLILALPLDIGLYSTMKNLYYNLTYFSFGEGTSYLHFTCISLFQFIVFEQRNKAPVSSILSYPTAQKYVYLSERRGIQTLLVPTRSFLLTAFNYLQSQQKGTYSPIRSISPIIDKNSTGGIGNYPLILIATCFYSSNTLYSRVIPFSSLSNTQPGLSNYQQQFIIQVYQAVIVLMSYRRFVGISIIFPIFSTYQEALLKASSILCSLQLLQTFSHISSNWLTKKETEDCILLDGETFFFLNASFDQVSIFKFEFSLFF